MEMHLICIMQKKNIAIFASGNGSNAGQIIKHFRESDVAEVALVVCNRAGAAVIDRSRALGVAVEVIDRAGINNPELMNGVFDRYGIDVVVLAGFLLMVPDFILERYHDNVLNIHPSLLPRFGGKGMYGRNVHQAVVEAGEKESGITVHLVTGRCDEGRILFQASVPLSPSDTADDVEQKVHELEYRHYPEVIEKWCGM
ncbi:MAG: phosphoribosylglycinamide formyltransferase [Muribaculaceae bacterium]|nr:phosphoribosylglycinamide formyltransferase [Muribaculaceae bacterium]